MNILSFVCGALFAAGVCISGMMRPSKVLAFLDVGGAWDASLLVVFAVALALHAAAWRVVRRRATSPLGGEYPGPASPTIDVRLVGGAALFGIGWGISGFCPGPALIATLSGATSALVFFACVAATIAIYDRVMQRRDTDG
jgi:uncharacterized membrane protein YedE/YeeE